MQLVAYGAQDIYLTGNPQITFFKVVYRRHTNFSMEAIAQTFNGNVGYGQRVTSTISRNGDLVHRMYLETSFEAVNGTSDGSANIGSALINNIELEIGGQRIDRHTGLWMETWAELTEENPGSITAQQQAADFEAGVATGRGTKFQNMSMMGGVAGVGTLNGSEHAGFYIPLQFWFCRNPGLALPLIALQYHEVKVVLNINSLKDVHGGQATSGGALSMELFCDYIYLDTDERRRFAQVSHEYLIEQVQFEEKGGGTNMELNFNHPVKELIWVGKPQAQGTISQGPSTPTALPLDSKYQLKLNGHDRFSARPTAYFTRTQVWQYHTGPGGLIPASGNDTSSGDTIAVYSFALKPEEHQPSGTCNFSRIDTAQLSETFVSGGSAKPVTIFAVNYNVLRIMSGMGGLAYSN